MPFLFPTLMKELLSNIAVPSTPTVLTHVYSDFSRDFTSDQVVVHLWDKRWSERGGRGVRGRGRSMKMRSHFQLHTMFVPHTPGPAIVGASALLNDLP